MFRKLKEKITENSPQRLQQITQSISDKLQNSTTSDDNFFSIGENDNAAEEAGFTSISLGTHPDSVRIRKNSNSSISSDVSFLPKYESISNMYHLQSDLDVSASEMEDNASSSSQSQLGHLSKEQIYAAFQKSQLRYHKYRGRYTDLARHYKDLEREIGKMKQVLVETQDKAIRRVIELKEQCALEQKAKAHLEGALRDELDEKQFKIQTLQTKIGLLQNGGGDLESSENNLDVLTKYLNDARLEIESLNEKIQENKANTIIFQSKENEYKSKIASLESELRGVADRERENNLKLAQSKMDLHNEILSKDAEITNLKKQQSDSNLQSQNLKLIEKIEHLTNKCNNFECELLKIEQYKQEVEKLREIRRSLEAELKNKIIEQDQIRIDTKNSLLSLESKIRDELYHEFQQKEREKFENLFPQIGNIDNLQKQLNNAQELSDKLEQKQIDFDAINDKYSNLESNHLELIQECNELRNEINQNRKEFSSQVREIKMDAASKAQRIRDLECENKRLEETLIDGVNNLKLYNTQIDNLKSILSNRNEELSRIETEKSSLEVELKNYKSKLLNFENELKTKNDSNFELSQLRKLLDDKLNEIELLNHNKVDSESKLNELEKNLRLCETEKIDSCKEINKFKIELNDKTIEIDKLNAGNSKLIEKNGELLEKVRLWEEKNLEGVVENLESRLKQLQDQCEMKRCEIEKMADLIEKYDLSNDEKNQLEQEFNILKTKYHDKLREFYELSDEKSKMAAEMEKMEKKVWLCQEKHPNSIVSALQIELDELKIAHKAKQEENLILESNLRELNEKVRLCEERDEAINLDKTETGLLEMKLQKIEEEKLALMASFENERIVFEQVLSDNSKLKRSEEHILELERKLEQLGEKLVKFNDLKLEVANLQKDKFNLETKVDSLSKKVRLYEEKDEAIDLERTESRLLEMKLQQMELDRVNLLEGFENERKVFEDLLKDNTKLKEAEEKVDKLQEASIILNDLVGHGNEQLNEANQHGQLLHDENLKLQWTIDDLQSKIDSKSKLVNELEDYKRESMRNIDELVEKLNKSDIEKEELSKKLMELKLQVDQLLQIKSSSNFGYDEVDDSIKQDSSKEIEELKSSLVDIKRKYDDLDKQYSDLATERQLLREEMQEMKHAPVQSNRLDDLQLLKGENLELSRKFLEEIDGLREKLMQYKSLDLTNRSSIEFYESELQKLKNKNEKLNNKLDETLVTLNHCAELSSSTEIEYLRNVLYNYMLGKESLVLARVIAAVCKFDPQQTEAILQKEQQKQTLLGQLGII